MYVPEILQGATVSPLRGYAGATTPIAGVRGVNGSAIGFDDATLRKGTVLFSFS